jgi:hypothetical protein
MSLVGFYVLGLPITFGISMVALMLHFWGKP